MTDQTENPVFAAENTAQTMRNVMAELGKTETLANPAPDKTLIEAALVTTPTGRNHHDLTSTHRAALEYLKPARRKGTARLADLQSLTDWAQRFKGDTSALFAEPDMDAPTITCIADYHAAGPIEPTTPTGDPTARHCHHRAVYNFPLSNEWKAWMEVSDTPMEKDDLGEFIEANAKDIMDPTPAILKGAESDKNKDWENRLILTAQQIEGRYGQLSQLLKMSKQFQVYETSDLKIATNRDSGESEIQFLNEHKTADGKPLNIPNLIIIAIPVFANGAPYRMPVRFRYRKSGGQIRFILSLYNPEKSFEAAFDVAVNKITADTELPMFKGTPES
ncbi:DUF2303 family protein [Profundibacter sp.]